MIEEIKNIDKRVWIAAILILAIVAILSLYVYFINKSQEETVMSMEEILESLTAPEGSAEPVSEEVFESLTAPEGTNVEISEEVLNSLTAPNN